MAMEQRRAFANPGDEWKGFFSLDSVSHQFRNAGNLNDNYVMSTRTFLPAFAGPRPGAARGMPQGYGYADALDPEIQVIRNVPIPKDSLPMGVDPDRQPYGFLAPRNPGMYVAVSSGSLPAPVPGLLARVLYFFGLQ